MAKLNLLNRSHTEKPESFGERTKGAAQTSYIKARDAIQTTYSDARFKVQDTMQPVLTRTQAALLAGLTIAQGLLHFNQQQNERKLRRARKNLHAAQEALQDSIMPRWKATRSTMQDGLSTAQGTLAESTKRAQKSLLKAQKSLKDVQDVVGSGWEKTQEAIDEGKKKARKNLKRAASDTVLSAKGMKESMQEQYESRVRRRLTSRMLFRWGLIVGVVLAILYTPYPGSEVRKRVADQWQRVRSYISS